MNAELAQEWIDKVEEDWTAVRRLQAGGIAGVESVVAFHAQQCIEKYLKALLQSDGAEPPRLHHLGLLVDLLASAHPSLEEHRPACEVLTPFAVQSRYPGQKTDAEDAQRAIQASALVRAAVRAELRLPGD